MHIGEQKYQRVLALHKHGKSFFQYAKDLGCLDEHVMIIHAIWADEHDIDAIADCGCSVVHNPVSNLWIGSGVMPYRRLWDRGIPIGLGIDDMAVDGTFNLWGVAKTAGVMHRISEPDWFKVAQGIRASVVFDFVAGPAACASRTSSECWHRTTKPI